MVKTAEQPEHVWGNKHGQVKLDTRTLLFSGLTTMMMNRWRRIAPLVDVDLEILKAASWCVDAGKVRGGKKNYSLFLGNWIRRAQVTAETTRQHEGGRSSRWL